MTREIKHYGKSISEMNREEKMLLLVDNQTTELYRTLMENPDPIETVILIGLGMKLTHKRVEIIIDLLNIKREDFNDVDEICDYIETTDYSYSKYLADRKKNESEMKVEGLINFINLN